MYYSDQQLEQLADGFDQIGGKWIALATVVFEREYRTAWGRELATDGFLRRLKTLRHCINRVFSLLPPTLEEAPADGDRDDATIAVQAFMFNAFGCMENLAGIWVKEKDVRAANGSPLARGRIGMGSKYVDVRRSFTEGFRDYLAGKADWITHFENYRHALAHRIPLFIPPHCVSPENGDAYRALEEHITAAIIARNPQLEAELRAQQCALTFFRPWMVHSISENNAFIVIHPQILSDFATVEEMAYRMLEELYRH